jgi:hypothetical protein
MKKNRKKEKTKETSHPSEEDFVYIGGLVFVAESNVWVGL